MAPKNIGRAFLRVASENSDFMAIATSTLPLTYGNLKSVVEAFALRMTQNHIDRDSIVVMHTNDMVASLSAVLASSLIGCRFGFASKTLSLAPELSATHILATTDSSVPKHLKPIVIDGTWAPHIVFETDEPLTEYEGPWSDEDPWLYTSTSGTTGAPKIMALSQAVVFARSMAARADYIPFKTKFVPLFGCTARPFLSRAISALLSPCTIIEGSDFDFWNKSDANLVVGSPEQVKDVLFGKEIAYKFDELHMGGDAVETDVAQEMLQYFTKVVNLYGASETNRSFKNIFSLDQNGDLTVTGQMLDSEVEIVDENDIRCDVGEPGSVRVRNPYLAPGYINNQEAEARNFRDGWFYPGDHAEWGINGDLRIIAREDDLINLGGTKIDVRVTENALLLVEGIKDAVAFRNPKTNTRTELIAFVELEPLTQVQECIEKATIFCHTDSHTKIRAE